MDLLGIVDWRATELARLGVEVLVYDGTRRHPGPQAVELAVNEGRRVSLVSIDAQVAQELTYAERVIWKRRMYDLVVPMTFDHQLVRVGKKDNRINVHSAVLDSLRLCVAF